MSSGTPTRRTGTSGPTAATPSGPEGVDRVERLRRLDHAGRDRVRGHAVGPVLDGERAHEADEAGLGGGVVRVLGPAETVPAIDEVAIRRP